MPHPPQDGRMRQADAAFLHHAHQVAIAQLKAQVPTNAQNHNLLVKVSAFKEILQRCESRHSSILSALSVCTRTGPAIHLALDRLQPIDFDLLPVRCSIFR
jgi:hypothetical protein